MKRYRACATCLRIRLYILAAFPLIALIYIQPEGAQRLAALMPDTMTVAVIMMVIGSLSFAAKYTLYYLEQVQDQG